MGPTHARFAAVALTSLTLVASGCGASKTGSASSSGSNENGPLTSTELIAKADSICHEINAMRPPARQGGPIRPRMLEIANFERTEQARLARLSPPASLEQDWQQILGNLQTIATEIPKLIPYASSNRLDQVRPRVLAVAEAEHHFLATTRRDGFRECSKFH